MRTVTNAAVVVAASILTACTTGGVQACTWILVGRLASSDGSVMTSHTCDSHRTGSLSDREDVRSLQGNDRSVLESGRSAVDQVRWTVVRLVGDLSSQPALRRWAAHDPKREIR
jgi:hypothetical protein